MSEDPAQKGVALHQPDGGDRGSAGRSRGWETDLRASLRALYKSSAPPRAWRDSTDHGFIGVHLIERSIAAMAPRLSGRLIDVGCGSQPYRSYFDHMSEIIACDYDGARGSVDFACPADRIPVEAETFDAVLCTEVLEHVPDPLAVWREFHRILRPGGRVLLTTPMYWPGHEEPFDFYRYPKFGLRYLVEEAGFRVEEFWPRGGYWALLGQVGMHALAHYLQWRWMRYFWNNGALRLDRWRANPALTMGWMVLAQKR